MWDLDRGIATDVLPVVAEQTTSLVLWDIGEKLASRLAQSVPLWLCWYYN
jgi:hypothetical protein